MSQISGIGVTIGNRVLIYERTEVEEMTDYSEINVANNCYRSRLSMKEQMTKCRIFRE